MRLRWYWILTLLLSLSTLPLAWLTMSEAGLQWIFQQSRPYLSTELRIGEIQGRLLGPIDISDLHYKYDGVAVSARHLEVDWSVSSLLRGYVDISRIHINGLVAELPVDQQDKASTQGTDFSLSVQFPWRIDLRDLQISELTIQQQTQTSRIKRVRASARAQFNQINIDLLAIEADSYSLNTQGYVQTDNIFKHALQLQWQVALASGDILNGQGEVTGDMHRTRITQQLSKPQSLNVKAELFDLLQQPHWQTDIEVPAFDSAKWQMDLPEIKGNLRAHAKGDLQTAAISGHLQAQRNDVGAFSAEFQLQWLTQQLLQIDRLSIRQAQAQTQILATGEWRPGTRGGQVDLELEWSRLRWPLQAEPWFSSSSGKGSVQGSIDDYRFEIHTDRPLPQLPVSNWYAIGSGDLQALRLERVRVSALEGEINATGELDWSSQLAWKAEVKASQLNPAEMYPDWPGRLDAQLRHQGRLVDGQVSAEVDIQRIDGMLRNYPLALKSQLTWRDNGVDISGLQFRSGSSLLKGRGRVDQNLQLEWELASANLAELYPDTGGELRASGQLGGDRNAPKLNLSLSGKALTFEDFSMAAIDGSLILDMADLRQIDVRLQASGLGYQQYQLDTLEVSGSPRQLRVKTSSEELQADLEFRGEATQQGWQGRIERADLSSDVFKDWRLKIPVNLSVIDRSLQLDQACWQSSDQASLCASVEQQQAIWRSQLQLGGFPLQTFKHWLPSDLDIDALVDASAQIQLGSQQLQGQARIDMLPGKFTYPLLEAELEEWTYEGGVIQLSLNQEGLQSQVELKLNDTENIQGKFSLPGANVLLMDIEKQAIEGWAKMSIGDLNPLASLIPEVQQLRGQAGLDITLAGTLNNPQLSGQAYLQQGSFAIPRLGLNIKDLDISAQSEGFNDIKFTLGARSGDGTLKVQGVTRLDKAAGWPTEMAITGKDVEISQIPEARITASPDLQIKVRQHHVEVTGKVEIPYANLQPRDISTATRVSSDVVIIGQEQEEQKKWVIESRVQLVLGDRVHFYGYGFEGRLGGGLMLQDEPGQPTRATGDITIPEGRYRAYGQQLDVEHGRLLFAGGPLTNPGLDIRAVRKVNTIIAGLKVRGTVNQPQVELYSIPALGQTDTLSYLLLGRPMENASNEEGAMMAKATLALGLTGGDRLARTIGDQFGLDEMRVESSSSGDQASLVVGRYLSPQLYVSYGIGLIEAFNTFTVRYQISDKWQLKAESGETQGADLLYTFERE